jgi:hypothetical protein
MASARAASTRASLLRLVVAARAEAVVDHLDTCHACDVPLHDGGVFCARCLAADPGGLPSASTTASASAATCTPGAPAPESSPVRARTSSARRRLTAAAGGARSLTPALADTSTEA